MSPAVCRWRLSREVLPADDGRLWINVVSGALLFAPEATRWALNPDFLLKMFLVFLGVYLLRRIRLSVFRRPAAQGAEPVPVRGRALAATSLAVWLVAIFAGRMTAYVDGWTKFMSLFKVS